MNEKVRTPSGHQSSSDFEAFIADKIALVAAGPRSGYRIEALLRIDLEEAREWLLARETDARCRGIIKRTSRLETLRAMAYNLA